MSDGKRRRVGSNVSIPDFFIRNAYSETGEGMKKLQTLISIINRLNSNATSKPCRMRAQFQSDFKTMQEDADFIGNIKDIASKANRTKKKLLTQFTRRAINVCMQRLQECSELRREFTTQLLITDPCRVLQKCKLIFCEIDNLSLDNVWWTQNSTTRGVAVIRHTWKHMCENQRCTTTARLQFKHRCRDFVTLPVNTSVLDVALNDLIEIREFVPYKYDDDEWVTSAHFLKLESGIENFAHYYDDSCRDCDYGYDGVAYQFDSVGNFTRQQLEVFVEDAVAKLPYRIQLTDEQQSCILMILQSRFSLIDALGGTGKTNVVARIAIHILEKLKYTVVAVTPTHAAKRPICAAMGWKRERVHTIHSLTFDCGKGSGLFRKFLCDFSCNNDDKNSTDDDDEHSKASKPRLFFC